MSATWGNYLKLTIFGESHGKAIGIVLEGVPPGITLDKDFIHRQLQRRAPGQNKLSTQRQEKDQFEILSGYFKDKTTGTPMTFVIANQDQYSRDYTKQKNVPRPGHGDYPGYVKYHGFNDYRGGGHFSGRLTAPLVLAGAIAQQLLKIRDIHIGSHIKSIYNIQDEQFNKIHIQSEQLESLKDKDFPVLKNAQGQKMKEAILEAKNDLDSLGGVIETAMINIPAGLGSPFFDSVESRLAHMLFSIPAVKGVEFGSGFDLSTMKGSQGKDEYRVEEGQIKTLTNHNGGILGGITTGMPIIFNTAFKPTPSIGQRQRTIDIEKMENIDLEITGRHDPCILPRAVPVVEAVGALGLLDLIIEREGRSWMS